LDSESACNFQSVLLTGLLNTSTSRWLLASQYEFPWGWRTGCQMVSDWVCRWDLRKQWVMRYQMVWH
jgi:hypothetical protein